MKRLLLLLLILPVLAGVFFTADFAATWSHAGEGAPTPAITGADLVPSRRAAGEAQSQANLLITGSTEVADGAGELADGMEELKTGMNQAANGSQQLSSGLTQLKAGTGELASGARQIADGVSQAADMVNEVGVIKQEILMFIEKADTQLARSASPEVEEARKQLADLRTQVEAVNIDAEVTDKVAALRTGSRELADRITGEYTSGVNQAASGAQQLTSGLGQLQTGTTAARDGSVALKDGAEKVQGLAERTQAAVNQTSQLIPVVPVVEEQPDEDARTDFLPPLYAFLISAMVMLAASLVGLTRNWRWRLGGGIGLALVGLLMLALMSTGATSSVLAGMSGILALTVAAALLCASVLWRFIGRWFVLVGVMAQVAIVGWTWKRATGGESIQQWLADLMPLNYPTAALTALGNGGSSQAVWVAVGVLGLLIIIAAGLEYWKPARHRAAVD
ncbi:MAG: hypothetical protein SPI77_03885 [Corynebacterium sp.]|nr:hypothetical protein [Corynebacterium sp.]